MRFLNKYKWLIKASGIAKEISMNADLFLHKLNPKMPNRFNPDQLMSIKLELKKFNNVCSSYLATVCMCECPDAEYDKSNKNFFCKKCKKFLE